jgi:4-amino-4-deoxy-L-arabinose transferase-like glycosyltransferase
VLAVERHSFVFNDTFYYFRTADLLAHGHGFSSSVGVPTAQWPPVFPFLLSLLFRVTGSHETAGQVMNAVLGALTVPALYALARKTFARTEATVAAAALALLPGQIMWTDVLLAETLYALVLVCFFLLAIALPPKPWAAAVLGVAIGLAALTRGEGLLLIPAVLAIWWPRLPSRARAGRAALLVALAALTIAPWTIRNAIVMDAFIPLSSNSSTTLWSGHNPGATGAQVYAGRDLLDQIPQTGKEREVEEAKLLRREALKYMRTHPGRELELIPLKLFNLNRGDSWAMEWVNAGDPGKRPFGAELGTPVRVAADTGYYALLAATIASLLVLWHALWRRPAIRGVLVLFAGSLVLYGFVYYGNYRYRAPLEPLMLLGAAPLLARLPALRERRAM